MLGLLESEFKPEIYVTERGGDLADDLLLRRFTDGDVVILDLCDSDTARELILCQKDKRIPFKLAGRGHATNQPGHTIRSAQSLSEARRAVAGIFARAVEPESSALQPFG